MKRKDRAWPRAQARVILPHRHTVLALDFRGRVSPWDHEWVGRESGETVQDENESERTV